MNLENILSNRNSEENLSAKSCEIKRPTNNSYREYVVTLHNYEDLDQFYIDMKNETGIEFIPNRSVQRTNKRPLSRNTHYILTNNEAEKLKKDPRVLDVDLTLEEKGVVAIPLGSTTITNGVFARKSSNFNNTDINWGLLAHSNPTAVSILDEAGTDYLNTLGQANYSTWGSDRTGNATATVTLPFNGENVDVVIIDDEIPPLHPEFAVNTDGSGGSRVNQIDWWSLYRTVVQEIDTDVVDTSVPNTYTYGDYGDHGTHVAGTAVGNRLGWARKANIYNLYAYSNIKVPLSLMYDLLRAFHLNKPINPLTGIRNPTITNHSYGLASLVPITQITQFNYRGSLRNVSYTNTSADLNLIKRDYGLWGGLYTTFVYGNYPTQSSQNSVFVPHRGGISDQVDIEDAIRDGLIFVAAAGNSGDTSVDSSHPDYNNQIIYNYQSQNSSQTYVGFVDYYKQGMNPANVPSSITVGNLDSVAALKLSISSNDNDQVWCEFKNNSSSHGNTCDVWAAGTNILSSVYTSQTLKDPRNTLYSLGVLTGTSMASPQIAGMIACFAERYPRFKQNDFLELLKYYGYNYPRVFSGVYHKHSVTNNGASAYNFTANADRLFEKTGLNQSFDIRIGEIVEFSINTPGHPFWIKTTAVTGTGSAVTTGITNNGTQSGTIIWDTTGMSTGIYYYICQFHSGMQGTITLRYSQLDRTYTALGAKTQPYALFPTSIRKTNGYITSDVFESPRPTSGLTFPRKRIWQR
jgi:plastocyanin